MSNSEEDLPALEGLDINKLYNAQLVSLSLQENLTSLRNVREKLSVDRPERPHLLDMLAWILDESFQDSDDLAQLEEAASARRESLDLTPPDTVLFLQRAYRLAMSYTSLYEITLLLEHLDPALSIIRKIIDVYTGEEIEELPNRYNMIGYYASLCHLKCKVTNSPEDVDLASDALALAQAALPPGHPAHPKLLWMRGFTWLDHFNLDSDSKSLSTAFDFLQQASSIPTASPLHLFHSACSWASEAHKHRHSTALEAYTRALDILPQTVWHGYGILFRMSMIASLRHFYLLDNAVDCAISAGNLELAVEWLDAGRSIIWGQLLNLRTPLDELRAVDPVLASRLEGAGTALENGIQDFQQQDRPPGLGQRTDYVVTQIRQMNKHEAAGEQYRLATEWEETLGEIRALPGFSDFLLPRPYKTLKRAAQNGPVIVITTVETHSAALIIRSPETPILHVSLPEMTSALATSLKSKLVDILHHTGHYIQRHAIERHINIRRVGRKTPNDVLCDILDVLWNTVVEPIFDALSFNLKKTTSSEASSLPRIWWYTSGPLAKLPLHAAGLHRQPNGIWAGDFALSSYIPMLSALIPHSDGDKISSPILQFPRLLVVGQADAPGAPLLPGATKEIEEIKEIVTGSKQTLTVVEGVDATVEKVLSAMQMADFIHVASHGEQSRDMHGLYSALLLHDGRLDISRLIRARLPHAHLAFLSACETATGDDVIQDEAAHIASAMIFSGFEAVVATMWSILDEDGPFVADVFYSYMFRRDCVDTRDAALALHIAVRKLRASGAPLVRWVPFIHLGK